MPLATLRALTRTAVTTIALLAASAATAQSTVTLVALDGSTEITGELLEFDGEQYRVRTSLGVIAVPAAQVRCTGPGCPEAAAAAEVPSAGATESVAVAGSNLVGERLVPPLVEVWAADGLGLRTVREAGLAENEFTLRLLDDAGEEHGAIEVAAHGTAAGFAALADGRATLALASRPLAPGEAGLPPAAAESGTVLARDAVVVVVHSSNAVDRLGYDELAALFAGRIANWRQLGGADRPVRVYLPTPGSGTRDIFEAAVMRPRNLALARDAETVEDLAELADLVSIDPAGVGITGFAVARGARMLALRQPCGLLSRPTRFSVRTGEYPLARRLYAYRRPDAALPELARGLLEFALSDAAQPIIADAGFIDRGIETEGIDMQGGRLAHALTTPEEFSLELMREMLSELAEAERLSVTFRFDRTGETLDPDSAEEAERLARLLAEGRYAGKEILLVGFSDSVGEFAENRERARQRAEMVLAALRAAVPEGALDAVPILVRSYGELAPVGCNETREGRALNRRVEVWVRKRR